MSPEPRPASPPSIAVVIAVRNGAATLQRALDSVFEQTHPAVELIVMDAASTDGTVQILERNSPAGSPTGNPSPTGASSTPGTRPSRT